jgi:hypothetical protein
MILFLLNLFLKWHAPYRSEKRGSNTFQIHLKNSGELACLAKKNIPKTNNLNAGYRIIKDCR